MLSLTFASAQSLPLTVISPDVPNFSSYSFFTVLNGNLLYVTDTFQLPSFNRATVVMKVNPSTNQLDPFFVIPNKKGTFNSLTYNAIAGKYILEAVDGAFKRYYYAGTPNNMVFIDSFESNIFQTQSVIAGNQHYILSNDSIYSMLYTPNSISLLYSAPSNNKDVRLFIAAENELLVGLEDNNAPNIFELIKFNNGNPIVIDTTVINSYKGGIGFKDGSDLYLAFKEKVLKIDAINQISTYNFNVKNVIGKLGNKLIGINSQDLKVFDMNSQIETILSSALSDYFIQNKVVYNNNICYIEASTSSGNLIVVTDGTATGTKNKILPVLATRGDAWALCGNNLVFEYKDNNVGYEVAILKPDTTLSVYDQKSGSINGIDPSGAYNANGTAYLLYQGTTGVREVSRVDQCNTITSEINVFKNNEVSIYPNPGSSRINILSDKNIIAVKIFDVVGKNIFSDVYFGQKNIGLNTKALTGNYWIQILTEDGLMTNKHLVINQN